MSGRRPHGGTNRCCCGCYENSIAYYIEKELNLDINLIWNWDENNKNNINPYHISKGYNGKIWLYCLEREYHNYNINKNIVGYSIMCNNFLSGKRCTYCGNRKTHYFDSLGFLYHDIAKMIVEDERNGLTWEDTYSIAPKSNKRFYFKCDKCNQGSTKPKCLGSITRRGFSCEYCSDGISIPEKFMISLLQQLNLDYIIQYNPNWSNNKKYDFYIPSLNIIIETHGLQHYEESSRGRSLEEERENDKLKKELALGNGVKNYIVVDCRYSKLDWLKKNIIKELENIFNLKNIDWNETWKRCQRSKCIEAWNLWNQGLNDTKIISEILDVSVPTTINYLKSGSLIGKCNYDKSITIQNKYNKMKEEHSYNSKKIICITTKKIFHSISDACKYYNTSGIYQQLKGRNKSAGKLNGTKLVWRYLIWNHGKKYRIKKNEED